MVHEIKSFILSQTLSESGKLIAAFFIVINRVLFTINCYLLAFFRLVIALLMYKFVS